MCVSCFVCPQRDKHCSHTGRGGARHLSQRGQTFYVRDGGGKADGEREGDTKEANILMSGAREPLQELDSSLKFNYYIFFTFYCQDQFQLASPVPVELRLALSLIINKVDSMPCDF